MTFVPSIDVNKGCIVSNPKGWQKVAGGRSGAKTSGLRMQIYLRTPKGVPEAPQRFCDPCGHPRSGGVAALNPRLLSDKPPA